MALQGGFQPLLDPFDHLFLVAPYFGSRRKPRYSRSAGRAEINPDSQWITTICAKCHTNVYFTISAMGKP
jgi:hypothetical protein